MHGTGRDAQEYLDDWRPAVELGAGGPAGRPVVVLAPEFDRERFPGAEGYNLGASEDSRGEVVTDPAQWTFGVPDALFEVVRTDLSLSASTFGIYGHSAGAQFVHRMLYADRDARVDTAVAANAGWYTLPDPGENWPYGLDGDPFGDDDEVIEAALSRHLVVALGAEDIDEDDPSLRHSDRADEQGRTRFERGGHFLAAAREIAADRDLDLAWELNEVPGVDHDHTAMAHAAQRWLLMPAPASTG